MPITQDKSGAVVATDPLKGALERIAAVHGKIASFLPVIVVKFSEPLLVEPDTIAPQADGSVLLNASQADHFLNYNGLGYDAPNTLYKLRWNIKAKPGIYQAAVSYLPKAQAADVCLTVNGKTIVIKLDASDGGATSPNAKSFRLPQSIRLIGRTYTTIELTPPQPFFKGTPLQADIQQLTLTPVLKNQKGSHARRFTSAYPAEEFSR